ncbi:MAG: glycosyltransferase family 2 protein [Gammaproteobacteria bacterium]|nr:glycosyltransferase family 2 protein [Gammaproteobacteria bacterium]
MNQATSIVIPAHNEEESLRRLLPELRQRHPECEIIVIDDGSTDGTPDAVVSCGATLISLPYTMGNGAAVKAGARAATGEIIVFMDGDGQHAAADVERLRTGLRDGYAMVVGARVPGSQASVFRLAANRFYNALASWITGRRIADLTSGFRVVEAGKFRQFLHLLPNGFSYPTTITMAFLRSGYPVRYVPIEAASRRGRSHIRPLRDGIRFLLIIFRIGTLYSPLKIFVPMSAALFLPGIGNYAYTYATQGRFTNMSALLLLASLFVFLIGLVSEQITALMYQRQD